MEHVRYPLGKTSGLAVAIVRHGYLFCTWEWVLGCLEFWRFYQFILLLLVRLGRITMTNAFSMSMHRVLYSQACCLRTGTHTNLLVGLESNTFEVAHANLNSALTPRSIHPIIY
jgi:hypothetical protein